MLSQKTMQINVGTLKFQSSPKRKQEHLKVLSKNRSPEREDCLELIDTWIYLDLHSGLVIYGMRFQ